jgi:putative membrane protein
MDEAARQCAAMMEATHDRHGATEGGWGTGGMMDMGGMGGMMIFGVLWLVIIAALAALVIFGAIWFWRRSGPPASPGRPSPRDTLDRRYAAGELDRETYLQMRSDLEASG